jgi:hypothetical protein
MNGSFENSSIGGWRLSYAVEKGFRQLKSWHGLPAMNIPKAVQISGHSTVRKRIGFPGKWGAI